MTYSTCCYSNRDNQTNKKNDGETDKRRAKLREEVTAEIPAGNQLHQ